MKNNTNYTLALETRPNSYEPIFIFPSIEKIDNLTSHYNEFDFSRMLIKNYYIDQENDKCPFTIIYNDNGLRKVKEGIIYKDEYNDNMNEYIKDFMNNYRHNGNYINQIYQYITNRKDISESSKETIHYLNIIRKESTYENNLDKIDNLSYYEIRTIYLYIIRTLIPKIELENNVKLTRRIEN